MTDPKAGGAPKSVPGGARWCEQHRRNECTKQRVKGRGECHNIAVSGTAVCLNHGGQSLDVLRARGEANKAITAFSALGGVPNIEPGYAVLASLHLSWLRLHLYASLLEQQVGAEHDEPIGSWNGDLEDEDFGRGVGRQQSPAGTAGLVGHTFAADKQAGVFASAEAVRALVALEAQERDRVVRFAKTAHDMGIAEREVKLAESQGALLAAVVRGILGDLDLSAVQLERAPEVIQRHLREAAVLEVTGGAA